MHTTIKHPPKKSKVCEAGCSSVKVKFLFGSSKFMQFQSFSIGFASYRHHHWILWYLLQDTKRRKHCGSCVGCLAEECGACKNCLDKKKFGGPGKRRQKCIARKCIMTAKDKLIKVYTILLYICL